jgi:hypothetical protein
MTRVVEDAFRWNPGDGNKIPAHLPDLVVKVHPIVRNGLIPKDHSHAFQSPNTVTEIPLYRVTGRKSLHNIFARADGDKAKEEAERQWLENKLGYNLNPFDNKSILHKYKVKLTDKVKEKPLELNLNNPAEYLDFLILNFAAEVTGINKPNEKSHAGKRYYLETEDFASKEKISKVNYTSKAFRYLGAMEANTSEMRRFYKMLTNKSLSGNIKPETIVEKLQDEVQSNAKKFVETRESATYKGYSFILEGMEAGAIIEDKIKGFLTRDGVALCYDDSKKADLHTAIQFLEDGANQTVKAQILEKINLAKQ